MKTKLTLFLFLCVLINFAQNEITIDNTTETLEFDLNFIKSAIIGPKYDSADTKVIRYKIKIPKHPTFQIEGNRFNGKTISALQRVTKNDYILIFDIQTNTIVQKKAIKFKVKKKAQKEETKLDYTGTLNGEIGFVELELKDLKSVIIGLNNTNETVIEYSIVIPRNKGLISKGNQFSAEILEVLKDSKKDDVITLFGIKTKNSKKGKNYVSFTISDQTNLVDYSKLVGTLRGEFGNLRMTKKTFKLAAIGSKNKSNNDRYSVKSFSIKINYDQVFHIKGNTLNNDIKEYIDYVKADVPIRIYNIIAKTKSGKLLENIEPINIRLK